MHCIITVIKFECFLILKTLKNTMQSPLPYAGEIEFRINQEHSCILVFEIIFIIAVIWYYSKTCVKRSLKKTTNWFSRPIIA